MQNDAPSTVCQCPACGEIFTPKRKDMKFCSPRCRKNSFSRRDRKENPRNSKFSPAKWRENMEIFDKNRCLVEAVYKEKRQEDRNRMIEDIISLAEEGHGKLRSLLLNKMFLYPDRGNSLLFAPAYEQYGTIAQITNRYSWVNWGCSIEQVLPNNSGERH